MTPAEKAQRIASLQQQIGVREEEIALCKKGIAELEAEKAAEPAPAKTEG